jgi:hypothetical protein
MGHQTLSPDEPAGGDRRHRLIFCSGPMGARANQHQPNSLPKS